MEDNGSMAEDAQAALLPRIKERTLYGLAEGP